MNKLVMYLSLLLILSCSVHAAGDITLDGAVDGDDLSVMSRQWLSGINDGLSEARSFSPVPAVGVHPRVLFNASDLPDIFDRLDNTVYGQAVWSFANSGWIGGTPIDALAALDLSGGVTLSHVNTYWTNDEGRNVRFFVTALDAVKRNDSVQKQKVIDAIVNYSKIIVASKTLKSSDPIWTSNNWNLTVAFTNGGEGLALTYDLLYNDMTTVQQDTVRLAIATATEGRRSWGMGLPVTRIVSNWSLYNANLVTMICAIEGETGFDSEVYDLSAQLAQNVLDFYFYPSGACPEDGYIQLALREGSLALVAYAKRGLNLFEHPNYKAMVRCYAQSIEPFEQGQYVGHASGGDFSYPSFWLVQKYVYPESIVSDYSWHSCRTASIDQGVRWQNLIAGSVFAIDYAGSDPKNTDSLGLVLDKTAFYPRRGLMISRSSWSKKALYCHFDARPEVYFPGHDNDDRGSFTLSALGTSWAVDSAWGTFQESTDHSLVHIDGIAQDDEAPSVKFLSWQDTGAASVGVADLEYAYDWVWQDNSSYDPSPPSPWVTENSTPIDLGWPGNESWASVSLANQPDLSFDGVFLWKKTYNPVEKAFRTVLMARGVMPYLLVIDDVKKDASIHAYQWYMHLNPDLLLDSINGNDIILSNAAGDTKLLVRVIDAGGSISANVESYAKNSMDAKRLIITTNATTADFKIMLVPHYTGALLPTTSLVGDQLTVTVGSQVDVFDFTLDGDGRTLVDMQRNGQEVLNVQ